ncbi:hypothetical protein BD626DRAFT_503510 [Schizophyllum amplum]|uniref:Uncharacterized protein n=1 Tax=Schizophyllum amplum TaxID=97359 RepID=A0A550C894_9AGAR|nr:hypothetical protein BD626DRAFT_503510 [Auriculariopsis ampla]
MDTERQRCSLAGRKALGGITPHLLRSHTHENSAQDTQRYCLPPSELPRQTARADSTPRPIERPTACAPACRSSDAQSSCLLPSSADVNAHVSALSHAEAY